MIFGLGGNLRYPQVSERIFYFTGKKKCVLQCQTFFLRRNKKSVLASFAPLRAFADLSSEALA
jgi:hypothetical protein